MYWQGEVEGGGRKGLNSTDKVTEVLLLLMDF